MRDNEERDMLRGALEKARAKIEEQDAVLKQVTSPPCLLANVVMLREKDGTVVISQDNKLIEVLVPADRGLASKVAPGATVRVVPDTMQITYVYPETIDLGDVAFVKQAVGGGRLEVDHNGTHKIVAFTSKAKEGDKVVLDASGKVVLRNIGSEEKFSVASEKVSWVDIGGLEDAKNALIEAVELPAKHPGIYKKYGKKPAKGILMFGPPGCGKTMLGKAVATSMASSHGAATSGFIYVKGPEILEPYVGLAERTVRNLFNQARAHRQKHGFPAVIFIDEADAILGKRGSGISSDIERTIVPMFLSEMDGLDDSGAIVLLTTNRPDVLDPAVVREGRVDRKVRIGRPTRNSARGIFELYLSKKPLSSGAGRMAATATDMLFCEKKVLFVLDRGEEETNITLGDICNGAMIAGIVEHATMSAMRREMEKAASDGIRECDMAHAVDMAFGDTANLSHEDAVEELAAEFGNDVKVRKAR
jgi:proteasome-associated ATPase